MHFAEQRHEERRFAGSSGADNQVQLPALEEELLIYVKHERPLATASGSDRQLDRVVRPGERCIAESDSACMFFRNGRAQDHCGFGLGFGELVDKLGLCRAK